MRAEQTVGSRGKRRTEEAGVQLSVGGGAPLEGRKLGRSGGIVLLGGHLLVDVLKLCGEGLCRGSVRCQPLSPAAAGMRPGMLKAKACNDWPAARRLSKLFLRTTVVQ
eukprot:COSAG04_NODE_730_length_10737_cov_31.931002_13_plen_108_part_00